MRDLWADEQPLPIALDGDTCLWLWHDLLPAPHADELFTLLTHTLAWQQPRLRIFGKEHATPRLTCLSGDAGYRYSGKYFAPTPWSAELLQLRDLAQAISGHSYNSVLANLYRDGKDHMGWHADDEPELGATPWIASLSLGAKRDFCFKRKGSNRSSLRLALPHNSLLLMAPEVQRDCLHAVPARAGIHSARLNLTFRLINPAPV